MVGLDGVGGGVRCGRFEMKFPGITCVVGGVTSKRDWKTVVVNAKCEVGFSNGEK